MFSIYFGDVNMSAVIGILMTLDSIIKSYYKVVAHSEWYNVSEHILLEI